MRKFSAVMLLALGFGIVGCGSNSNGNINGNWNASLLQRNNGPTVFSFATAFTVTGNGALNVSNFHFNTNSPCFVSGEAESGGFSLSGHFNGDVSGSFNMTVKSGVPAGDTLNLTGTATGNTITGHWQLTGGSGCRGSGVFMMTKM